MASNVWPVDAVSGVPSYTGRMLRQNTGAWAPNPSRPLCPRTGVIQGTLGTIATATGTTWTVTPFRGVIDGETSAAEGGYNFSFDTNQTGSVTAANASNPRIDLLAVQLSDPAAGDGTSTPGVAIVYTAGTAAASPVAPATPARSFALATITVPAVGGGSPSVTFVAPYAVAAGGILRVTSSAGYPANPAEGDYVDDATTNSLMRYNGASWSPEYGRTYTYNGTPYAGSFDATKPIQVYAGRINTNSDANALVKVTFSANALLTMHAEPETNATAVLRQLVPRYDLCSTTQAAWQLVNASGAQVNTSVIFGFRVEYQ